MRRDDFVAERSARWEELDGLLRRAKLRPERLGAEGVLRLGDTYRATTADLALARRRFAGDPIVEQLTTLVHRARPVVYERERRSEGFVHFVTTGYWQRVRECPAELAIAAALLIGTWALVAVWARRDPTAASALVPEQFSGWGEARGARVTPTAEQSTEFSAALLTNNIRVAFFAFVGGVAAGLGSALALIYNGLVLGATTGLAMEAGNGRVLAEWLPAHGVLELTCFVVAGAAGMRMGWALVVPGNRSRAAAMVAEARPATEMALGAAAFLVFAAFLEAFVSPSSVGMPTRITVGLVAGGGFWILVFWRGRPSMRA